MKAARAFCTAGSDAGHALGAARRGAEPRRQMDIDRSAGQPGSYRLRRDQPARRGGRLSSPAKRGRSAGCTGAADRSAARCERRLPGAGGTPRSCHRRVDRQEGAVDLLPRRNVRQRGRRRRPRCVSRRAPGGATASSSADRVAALRSRVGTRTVGSTRPTRCAVREWLLWSAFTTTRQAFSKGGRSRAAAATARSSRAFCRATSRATSRPRGASSPRSPPPSVASRRNRAAPATPFRSRSHRTGR